MHFYVLYVCYPPSQEDGCAPTGPSLPKGTRPRACLSPLLAPCPRDPVTVTHCLDRNQRESIKHKPSVRRRCPRARSQFQLLLRVCITGFQLHRLFLITEIITVQSTSHSQGTMGHGSTDGLAPGLWVHSGNLAMQTEEWDPTRELGFPNSSPAAPESLFSDLDPGALSLR